MTLYDAPYLDEAEHAALDHTGVPGVGGEQSGATARSFLSLDSGGIEAPGTTFDVTFTAPTDPAPSGTGASWDVGAPTIVTIDETDSYGISFYVDGSRDQADSKGVAYVVLNDDSVGPLYYWTAVIYLAVGTPSARASVSIPAVPLVAGDTLTLHCQFTAAPANAQAGLVVAR